jgi:hypothetical protein
MMGPDRVLTDSVSYRRFSSVAVLAVVGSWLLGWLPTKQLTGEGGEFAMFAGGSISLMASLLGAVPIALVRDRKSVESTLAVLKSIALRLALVLTSALIVALIGPFAPTPLLLWVVICHLVLLVVDTWYSCSKLRVDVIRKRV